MLPSIRRRASVGYIGDDSDPNPGQDLAATNPMALALIGGGAIVGYHTGAGYITFGGGEAPSPAMDHALGAMQGGIMGLIAVIVLSFSPAGKSLGLA